MEQSIPVNKSVASKNQELAAQNRALVDEQRIFCVNIMGAPGSGKTTLIEAIAQYLSPAEIAVIQGDLESDIDQQRLEKHGISTYQINTHSGCHLNAKMISDALAQFPLSGKRYLLIENVGNLVCPAGKQIGQHLNLVVSSTTEGSDKPKKYPIIFLDASLVVISKSDLAEFVDFNKADYLADIRRINGKAAIVETVKKEPASFAPIARFLEAERQKLFSV